MIETSSKVEILEEIISELQSQCLELNWKISNDKLMEILGLKKESYYREIYSFRKNHSESLNLKEFSFQDADLLCDFLKQVLKTDIVDDFFLKAGLYFSESQLSQLDIYFKLYFENSLNKHKLDQELMQLLVGSTKTFEDAFDSYFDDKFSLDFFVERSVQNFIVDKEIDTLTGSETYLKNYLFDKIKYKKISINELTDEYRKRYYYEIYGRHKLGSKMEQDKQKLLDFFGLNETSTLKDLKAKFKELLMIYHPDKNKDGHQKTQEIIENYNQLFELIR